MSPPKMRGNHVVGQWQIVPRPLPPVRPAATNRGRPTRLPRVRVLPPVGIDIGPGAEQPPNQVDLVPQAGRLGDLRRRRGSAEQGRRPCLAMPVARPGVEPHQIVEPLDLGAKPVDLRQQLCPGRLPRSTHPPTILLLRGTPLCHSASGSVSDHMPPVAAAATDSSTAPGALIGMRQRDGPHGRSGTLIPP